MNNLMETIIQLLDGMNRQDRIVAVARLKNEVIKDLIVCDECYHEVKDLATIEWHRRKIGRLEEALDRSYHNCLELEQKLFEKEKEVNTLKGQIKEMVTEAKMLNDPEFFMPTEEELICARDVGKIPSIKMYRSRTNCGLKISKDNIERAMELRGWLFYTYSPLVEKQQ